MHGSELFMHMMPHGKSIRAELIHPPGCRFLEVPKSRTNRMAVIRLFLSNSTVTALFNPALCLGIEFWSSLNMKVTRIEHPDCVSSFFELAQFVDQLKITQFVDDSFENKMNAWPRDGIAFLNTRLIRSMEWVHLLVEDHDLQHLHRISAKEMIITVLIDSLEVRPDVGWIDRTYEGMVLILRASDGQALIAHFEAPDDYFYLIRSEYNFRRGRCLGSYQRNALALARISKLMALSTSLEGKNPAVADDAKKKLREECIDFNEYNRGVSERDLLIDSIWRSKGQRRSPWGCFRGAMVRDMPYPVDRKLAPAYKFTKVGNFASLMSIRASDLCIGFFDEDVSHSLPIYTYLRRRIDRWLKGKGEINMIQLFFCLDLVSPVLSWIADNLSPELGWIDRTYSAMPLILRASDGQALLAYWDDAEKCIYLIRCEYNFRRGQCLGSYEKNEKSIRKIADLMRIASQLSAIRPALAEDAKEKLREECIKFNQYNKGATKMDLLTDSIWRPEGYRVSPWRPEVRDKSQYVIYPSEMSLF
ncbi:unnamed protein product, partial [Mesorhabditis spiculigera]